MTRLNGVGKACTVCYSRDSPSWCRSSLSLSVHTRKDRRCSLLLLQPTRTYPDPGTPTKKGHALIYFHLGSSGIVTNFLKKMTGDSEKQFAGTRETVFPQGLELSGTHLIKSNALAECLS